MSGILPNAVILVATIKALKYNGGVAKTDLQEEDLAALEKGLPNLLKHIETITEVYRLPAVVCGATGAERIAAIARLLEKGIVDGTGLLQEPYFETGIEVETGRGGKIRILKEDVGAQIQKKPYTAALLLEQPARIKPGNNISPYKC